MRFGQQEPAPTNASFHYRYPLHKGASAFMLQVSFTTMDAPTERHVFGAVEGTSDAAPEQPGRKDTRKLVNIGARSRNV